MGCPLLGFLPEIVELANRTKGLKRKDHFLAVAQNICRACRTNTPLPHCPLGEEFGCTLRRSLPTLTKTVAQVFERERGD